MALTVAELNTRLTADTKDFSRGMKQAEGVAQRFGTIGKAAIGTGIAIGASQAGRAIVDFVGKGITGAGALAESMSKTKQVFNESAGSVIKLADQLNKDFGLSKQSILDAASGIGLVGKAAGQTAPQAAAMGIEMAKLAADASSFFNVPLEEALGAIKSGLVGEAEPMRRFGVLLDEASVKAEGMRMGLIKSGGALTAQQKVMARASLITKGMGDATGDLERTQGSFANQVRKLNGQIENLGIQIGERLMPVALQLTTWLTEHMDDWDPWIDGAIKFGKGLGWVVTHAGPLGSIFQAAKKGIDTYGHSSEKVASISMSTAGSLGLKTEAYLAVKRSAEAAANVEKAATQVTEESVKAAKDFADAQHDVAMAARAVRNAGEARNDAFKEYNELLARGPVDIKAVADAERDLARAGKEVEAATLGVKDAEKALAKARQPATLEDLAEATDGVEKSAISLERAQMDVSDAQSKLTELQTSGTATALQLRDAELDVKSAVLRVRDAERDLKTSQEAANLVAQQGAEGTPAVIEAKDNLKTAEEKLNEQLKAQKMAAEELATARAGDPAFAEDLEKKKRALRDTEENLNDALRVQKQRTKELREAQEALGAIQGPLRDEIIKTNGAINAPLSGPAFGGPRMTIGPGGGGGGLLPPINVVVNGALDPIAVGNQIVDILKEHTRRSGRVDWLAV